MNSLEDADEVRTLPPLQKMPTRNALSTKTSRVSTRRCILAKSQFPGLLTTSKPAARKLHSESSEERKEPIWQAPCHFTNLKLDAISRISYAADITSSQDQFVGQPVKSSLAVINFGSPSSSGRKEAYQLDHMANTRNSLANFTEKYGPSQFIIYRGSLLSSTPEFQNYRSSYSRNWNAIAAVIRELEEFLRAEQVTLAIIDGIRVSEIASTNPTAGVFKEDLIACISNIDEIRMSSSFFFDRETSGQLQNRAAVKIQATTRKFIAVKRYKMRLLRNFCAVLIQCHVRRMIAVHSTRGRLLEAKSSLDLRWGNNVEKLKISWTKATTTDMSSSSFTIGLTRGNQSNIGTMTSKAPMTKNQIRLLIYIPSISSAEYIRLFTDRFRAIQNMHIACLYQLVDPHVQVVYVSPVQLSPEEVAYHESFLQLLGVPPSSAGVKRLHFIVPEMIDKLPPHMSLSQVLWCSSGALKKIRNLIRLMPNAVIIPTSLSWVEKRLSHHLNVPMLSPDPTIATTITSRSFSMGIFDEACVNTPQGSRDIYTSTDFYVALSSLITSSIDVKRWMFRLNGDNNNESYAYLDVDKLSVAASLRSEIASIVQTKQGGAWYSKRMQLEVRKRVMYALRSELPSKVTICRKDIHGGSWEHFEKHYRAVGLVIDAESNDVTGYVQGLCFIDPNGIVQVTGGVDLLMDTNYQVQGYIGPQTRVPHPALQGATAAVAKLLNEKWGVIGYVCVEYQTHLDPVDQAPRLQAVGLKLGLSPAFLGVGAAALAGSKGGDSDLELAKGQLPSSDRTHSKNFVYLPYGYHRPLSTSRDDIFLRVCKMNGVGLDVESRSGTLFFHIDAMIGGSISTLCMANSRRRAVDVAIHTLSFIIDHFGKDIDDDIRCYHWEALPSILSNLRILSKRENKKKKDITNY